MDSDGCIGKNGDCVFNNSNEKIINGVMELLRTLKFKPLLTNKKTKKKPSFNIGFFSQNDFVFKLKRKKVRQRKPPAKVWKRKIIKIEEVESVPVKCIQVDSASRLYLAGDGFVATHNTDLYGSFQSNSDWIIFAHKGRFIFKKTQLIKNKRAGTIPNIGRKPVPEYKTRFPSCWFGEDFPYSTENSSFQKKHNLVHPTIKGLKFIEWLILLSTNVGDTVVDPFVGSGTTALACQKLGRNFICGDIDLSFCEMGRKRLYIG
jgi:DNA modification methylase